MQGYICDERECELANCLLKPLSLEVENCNNFRSTLTKLLRQLQKLIRIVECQFHVKSKTIHLEYKHRANSIPLSLDKLRFCMYIKLPLYILANSFVFRYKNFWVS